MPIDPREAAAVRNQDAAHNRRGRRSRSGSRNPDFFASWFRRRDSGRGTRGAATTCPGAAETSSDTFARANPLRDDTAPTSTVGRSIFAGSARRLRTNRTICSNRASNVNVTGVPAAPSAPVSMSRLDTPPTAGPFNVSVSTSTRSHAAALRVPHAPQIRRRPPLQRCQMARSSTSVDDPDRRECGPARFGRSLLWPARAAPATHTGIQTQRSERPRPWRWSGSSTS